MDTSIKTQLIKIGNSRGVRIPKIWLDQLKFSDDVELVIQPTQLVIRPAHAPRAGWAEQFSAMAAHGDDALLDAHAPTTWEKDEWEW